MIPALPGVLCRKVLKIWNANASADGDRHHCGRRRRPIAPRDWTGCWLTAGLLTCGSPLCWPSQSPFLDTSGTFSVAHRSQLRGQSRIFRKKHRVPFSPNAVTHPDRKQCHLHPTYGIRQVPLTRNSKDVEPQPLKIQSLDS